MKKTCLILFLFAILQTSIGFSQNPPLSDKWFEIDWAYFQNNLINSGWGLEDEKNDGSIVAFVFRGVKLDFMYLNFAKGAAEGLCDYEYTFRGKYTYLKIIACEKNARKRFPPIIFYLTDENTLMLLGTEKQSMKNIDKVTAEDWYRFERVVPDSLDQPDDMDDFQK